MRSIVWVKQLCKQVRAIPVLPSAVNARAELGRRAKPMRPFDSSNAPTKSLDIMTSIFCALIHCRTVMKTIPHSRNYVLSIHLFLSDEVGGCSALKELPI